MIFCVAKHKEESSTVDFGDSESKLTSGKNEQNEETSPKSDNLKKDVQNIPEKNRKGNEPASKSVKDIQRKVEQLSINIGDESEEEAGKLAQAPFKNEGTDNSPSRVTSTDDNDEAVKESSNVLEKSEGNDEKSNYDNKERTTEHVQGDNSADKVDVVNTLVESVSANGNARGASGNEIKDQSNAYNIQQALANQHQDPSTQGKNIKRAAFSTGPLSVPAKI